MRAGMRLPLIILLAGALLAGCVGGPDDAVEAASAADANATVATTALDANATTAGAPRVVPLAHDGKIPAYAEACAFAVVVGRCAYGPPGADFDAMRVTPEMDGVPAAGQIVATWTATAPVHEELVLFAYSASDGSFTSLGWVMGPSPLALEPDFSEMPEGETLYVGLAPPNYGAGEGPAAAFGSFSPSEQPFRLEGQFTVAG